MGTIDSKMIIQTAKKTETAFEERAVDMSLVLPDYIPPISAILKCMLIPCISSRCQSGDRYSVDGMATVRLIYMSEDRDAVYCYEATQPFNVGFRAESATHHYTRVKVDYVNCRAISSKRVDIHGAFRVVYEGIGASDMTAFCDPHDPNLCCRSQTVTQTIPVGEAEKVITVDETVDLGVRMERLLYTIPCIVSKECKLLANKLIAKGVLRVKAVGVVGDKITEMVQDIPFSQILDFDGANEDWSCSLEVMISDNETYLQQSENGGALLFIKCKVIVCARLSADKEESLVLDAYHLKHPTVCEWMPLNLVHSNSPYTLQMSIHDTVSAPEHMQEVFDSWCEIKSHEIKEDHGQKELALCLNVCMIAKGEDRQLCYYERTVDTVVPMGGEGCPTEVCITQLSLSLSNGMLHVSADLCVTVCKWRDMSLSVVCDVICDDMQMFQKNEASVRLVYADGGELLWDIAKQHHARLENIMTENDLSCDSLSRPTMLMIPLL